MNQLHLVAGLSVILALHVYSGDRYAKKIENSFRHVASSMAFHGVSKYCDTDISNSLQLRYSYI